MHTFDPLAAATRAVRLARAGLRPSFDDGPVGDIERDALAEGVSLWLKAKSGTLYLAANASWPGLYKIGCTRRNVELRMRQLSGAGVPTPWVPYHTWAVHDAHGVEALAHRACARWLATGEIFHAPAEVLQRAIAAEVARDKLQLCTNLPDFLPELFLTNLDRLPMTELTIVFRTDTEHTVKIAVQALPRNEAPVSTDPAWAPVSERLKVIVLADGSAIEAAMSCPEVAVFSDDMTLIGRLLPVFGASGTRALGTGRGTDKHIGWRFRVAK